MNNQKTEDFRSQWAKVRQRGKVRFVVVNGVVWWLSIALLTEVVDYFTYASGRTLFDGNRVAWFFLVVVDPILGFLIGLLDWNRSERKYHV